MYKEDFETKTWKQPPSSNNAETTEQWYFPFGILNCQEKNEQDEISS